MQSPSFLTVTFFIALIREEENTCGHQIRFCFWKKAASSNYPSPSYCSNYYCNFEIIFIWHRLFNQEQTRPHTLLIDPLKTHVYHDKYPHGKKKESLSQKPKTKQSDGTKLNTRSFIYHLNQGSGFGIWIPFSLESAFFAIKALPDCLPFSLEDSEQASHLNSTCIPKSKNHLTKEKWVILRCDIKLV